MRVSIAPQAVWEISAIIYLTIVSDNDGLYRLDFPNKEVKDSYIYTILQEFSNLDKVESDKYIKILRQAIHDEDVPLLEKLMYVIYENIPYMLHSDIESYYHSIFFALLLFVGITTRPEELTAKGREDLILETSDKIYVIEMKYRSDPDRIEDGLREAMSQIESKRYAAKYELSGKRVLKMGMCVADRSLVKIEIIPA